LEVLPPTGSGTGGGTGGSTGGSGSGGGVTGSIITGGGTGGGTGGTAVGPPQLPGTLPGIPGGNDSWPGVDDDNGNMELDIDNMPTVDPEPIPELEPDLNPETEPDPYELAGMVSGAVVETALASINSRIALSQGDSTVMSASSLKAIRESEMPLTVILPNGLRIVIDPELITDDARDLDLNIDISIATGGEDIAGVSIPANAIIIAPSAHGAFGFTISFDIMSDVLANAGITAENAKKFHVAADGTVTDMSDYITVNSDGSITVHISHASAFYLTADSGSSLLIWLMIAAGIVLLAISATLLLMKRKRPVKEVIAAGAAATTDFDAAADSSVFPDLDAAGDTRIENIDI
jgi:hypothetical protein